MAYMGLRLALLPLFLVATGCATVVAGSAEEADAQPTSVTGVVVVDRMAVGEESATRSEASARFVKLRGAIDDGVLHLIGAGLDLPPVGECAVFTRRASSRSVELLDVGAISIESLASGQRVALAPRQVPDVVDLVSGTMYSARIDEAAVPSSSDVAVLVGGTPEPRGERDFVPAFSVRAKTPEPPANVRVVAIDASNVEVTWSAGSDAIVLDVGGSRCSFADDGRAVLASSSIGDDGAIVIHRVRREKLSIPGLDGGELRFDFARSITYRR